MSSGSIRGPPRLAVVGPQVLADAGEIDEAVDRAKKVIGRHMPLEAEPVEQRRLLGRPLSHHGRNLLPISRSESRPNHRRNAEFFNAIRPTRPFSPVATYP